MWTIDTVAFCTCLSNEYGSDVAASVPIIFCSELRHCRGSDCGRGTVIQDLELWCKRTSVMFCWEIKNVNNGTAVRVSCVPVRV